MKLSKRKLIFKIVLPTFFGIAGIAVPLILFVFQPKQEPLVEKVESGGGDIIIGNRITVIKGPAKEAMKEAFKEWGKELGLSPPVPKEEIDKQVDSLRKELSEERFKRAKLLSERGTERLEAKKYEGEIEDLEGALEILPEDSEAWASTNFNLGIALIKFLRGNKEAHLKKAIESYKKVLSFHTKEKNPGQYASAQNNMGIAYQVLSEVRDPEKNLGLAIKAYKEALRVYTFDAFPVQYATTQNNMGAAYQGLAGVREPEENLGLAIDAFNEALRVRTFDAFPVDYAKTRFSVGLLYLLKTKMYAEKGDVTQVKNSLKLAEEAFEESLKVFKKENMKDWAERTEKQLADARNILGQIK